MAVKITVLIENSPGSDMLLKYEHGLSVFVETDACNVLFDTGQSGAFMGNAKRMGVDVSTADYVVLSHGHYDHSGGFRTLAEEVSGFTLVAGKGFFREKYSSGLQGREFKGNNFGREYLENKGISLRTITDTVEKLGDGVYVVKNFKRIHKEEAVDYRYLLFENGEFVTDFFEDEIALVIDTSHGIVVFAGCSHPGIMNMIDSIGERFDRPVYAVIGGIHLVNAGNERIVSVRKYFEESSVQYLGLCHCTGDNAMGVFSSLEGRIHGMHTGSVLSID